MSRKTIEVAVKDPAIIDQANTAAHLLVAKMQGKADIAFTAILQAVNAAGAVVEQIEICTDDGRLRTFKDADDYLKAIGKLGLTATGTTKLTISGSDLLDPKPFTGDIIKKNTATLQGYAARKTKAVARSAALATEIGLMQADPSVPASLVAERQEQKTAVDDLTAWLTAEIARIAGVLGVPVP